MLTDSSNSSLKVDGAIKKVRTRKAKVKENEAILKPLKQVFEFGSKIDNERRVILSLPLKTVSEANCTQPWRTRHKRHKAQKNAVFFAFLEVKHLVKLPCTLTFVRHAPKFLDKHDNLPMSQKWLCDALCAEITGEYRPGLADNSDEIEIKYDQIKSSVYGVKIIIEF